jgi:hypothetical protein
MVSLLMPAGSANGDRDWIRLWHGRRYARLRRHEAGLA